MILNTTEFFLICYFNLSFFNDFNFVVLGNNKPYRLPSVLTMFTVHGIREKINYCVVIYFACFTVLNMTLTLLPHSVNGDL